MAADRPLHHVDGGFRNVPEIARPGLGVALPFFARRIAARFADPGVPPGVVPNDGAILRENAKHSSPTITWIGHATFLVQMDHTTFLTDPTWSDTASPFTWAGPRRFVPPGIALDALPPIDFVVLSHSHYDHTDIDTLRRLAMAGTRFITPLALGDVLAAEGIGPVEQLDWWQSTTVKGVEIHCVPAQHWSQRWLDDHNVTLWSGWAVVGPTRRFFFAGDTGYFPAFAEIGRRLGPIDLAAVPIGAYAPAEMMRVHHMNPEEAVQAAIDMGAQRMIGMHYGTFDLTEEPIDEPPRRFRAAAAAQGIDGDRVWTPAVGATVWW